MTHAYYRYNQQELLRETKIPLEVYDTDDAVFRAVADEMIEVILQKQGKPCVLIVPVGPVGQYSHFVRRVNGEMISLRNCWFINMDEYLDEKLEWLPKEHPLSFRGFMEREVYGKLRPELNLPPEQRIFPDPKKPETIPALLEALGGVDLAVGGIGINGHLAFNEAQRELSEEAFSQLQTRVLPISPETRTANAIGDLDGALEDMPTHAVTIGFREILEARKISLAVFRSWHRAVVRRAACGQRSAAFPVSLLQGREQVRIRMTKMVAR